MENPTIAQRENQLRKALDAAAQTCSNMKAMG